MMFISLKNLRNFSVRAVDGDIGKVVDVLFDDEQWVVRYLVVATGEWFNTRRVLLRTPSFGDVDSEGRQFSVALTVNQVRDSPLIDTDAPVSRYEERKHAEYYGLPYYWSSASLVGLGLFPGMSTVAGLVAPLDDADASQHDIHLRSSQEVCGYGVQQGSSSVGQIDDFIADAHSWAIRFLVLDTSTWWFGKRALISPRFATDISWAERTVRIPLDRQLIKDSPAWDESAGVNEAYAAELDAYYKPWQ